jgi:hypothetical protein
MTREEAYREIQAARELLRQGKSTDADKIMKYVVESIAEDAQRKGEW